MARATMRWASTCETITHEASNVRLRTIKGDTITHHEGPWETGTLRMAYTSTAPGLPSPPALPVATTPPLTATGTAPSTATDTATGCHRPPATATSPDTGAVMSYMKVARRRLWPPDMPFFPASLLAYL